MSESLAIFVDGDNLPARYADKILRCAASLGQVSVARVYGNEIAIGCWRNAPSFQFIYSGSEKNATDVLMAIEATEYVLSNRVGTVVLGSSDADFSHLARFIRARGVHVIGVGEPKTKATLRKSCSEFRELEDEAPPVKKQTHLTDLDKKVVSLIASSGKNGVTLTQFGTMMYQKHNTSISAKPDKTWRGYLSGKPTLYDLDPRGPNAKVRLKPDAVP